MASKKKGPAFDMDSAFSGLFSVPSNSNTSDVSNVQVDASTIKDASIIPEVETITESAVTAENPQNDIDPYVKTAPEGYESVVVHRKAADQLTRQYTITLKRGTHEALRDIAWYTRQSVSSILNNLADQYIREHQLELDECRKISRR